MSYNNRYQTYILKTYWALYLRDLKAAGYQEEKILNQDLVKKYEVIEMNEIKIDGAIKTMRSFNV